jgi:hypothetical protein
VQVLESWPHIYAALQGNATLLVYYGFTEGFLRSNRRSPDGEQWLQYMQQLLRQPGVQYVGLVNHTTLATALASAGFVLYPTSYPETGCITLMKARHSFLCVCVDHGRLVVTGITLLLVDAGDGDGCGADHVPAS